MNRQECEYLIGCLLDDIRRVVRMYDEKIDHVSMFISGKANSAVALTDDGEYQLNLYDDLTDGKEADE